MATWTYSDWHTYDSLSTRKTRLGLYIQELSEYLTQETGADGQSISSNAIREEIRDLRAEYKDLEARIESESGQSDGRGRLVQVRLRAP